MNEEAAPRIVDVRTVGVPVTDQDRALDATTTTTGVVIASYEHEREPKG